MLAVDTKTTANALSSPLMIYSGVYIDASAGAAATSTLALAADRLILQPFVPKSDMSIDQIGASVTVLGSGVVAKIGIYDSDSNGRPVNLLTSGPSDLNLGSTGFKSHSISQAFKKGRMYWLALHSSGIATVRAIALGSAWSLGLGGSNNSAYRTVIQRDAVTYAGGMPSTWTFNDAEVLAGVLPPSIRMRLA